MNPRQRKVEAFYTDRPFRYKFVVTFPTGRVKELDMVANEPLFNKIAKLQNPIISNNHSIWEELKEML
jgi:hypothetical protein